MGKLKVTLIRQCECVVEAICGDEFIASVKESYKDGWIRGGGSPCPDELFDTYMVSPSDMELFELGAIFYYSEFYEDRGGSRQHVWEIDLKRGFHRKVPVYVEAELDWVLSDVSEKIGLFN